MTKPVWLVFVLIGCGSGVIEQSGFDSSEKGEPTPAPVQGSEASAPALPSEAEVLCTWKMRSKTGFNVDARITRTGDSCKRETLDASGTVSETIEAPCQCPSKDGEVVCSRICLDEDQGPYPVAMWSFVRYQRNDGTCSDDVVIVGDPSNTVSLMPAPCGDCREAAPCDFPSHERLTHL